MKRVRGFTLIELLMVIAVVGVLAAIVLIAINPFEQLARTRDSNKKANIASLGKAIEAYVVLNGSYPNTNQWGATLITSGELKNLPTNNDPTVCNQGFNQDGYCYQKDDDGNATIYTSLVSTSDKSQCDSDAGAFYAYSTKEGKASIVCTGDPLSEPNPDGSNYQDASVQGPNGTTQAKAANSCRDIKANFPTSGDGNYWLDPNGGSTNDAFKTYCDMTNGGWTRILSLIDNGAKTNNMLGKGITFTRFRGVKASDHSVYQEATFTTAQTANQGLNINAAEALTKVMLSGPGGYGVYTETQSANYPNVCLWTNIEMVGSGYFGNCGDESNLKVGQATEGSANLNLRFDVDLFVINGTPL